eukprot:365116-Chlamydomonas_euryale.AAC.3
MRLCVAARVGGKGRETALTERARMYAICECCAARATATCNATACAAALRMAADGELASAVAPEYRAQIFLRMSGL